MNVFVYDKFFTLVELICVWCICVLNDVCMICASFVSVCMFVVGVLFNCGTCFQLCV